MRLYLFVIYLIIFPSQAISESIDIEDSVISNLGGVEIREISVRKAVIYEDYTNTYFSMLRNFYKDKDFIEPIIVPNQYPVNMFNEIVLFRYFTLFGVQEEAKVDKEISTILEVVGDIAYERNISLVSIRPTIKILQDGKEYYAEKAVLFYRLDSNDWKRLYLY